MGCSSSQDAGANGAAQPQPKTQQGQQPMSKAQEAGQPQAHIGFKLDILTAADEVTDIEVRTVKVGRDVLVRYISLDKEIRQVENMNVLKALKVKEEELTELNSRVQTVQVTYDQCVQKTDKEKADVDNLQEPSVKKFFEDQGQYDAQLTKEQEEYLEALNRQEIVKKELEGAKQQRDLVTNEVNSLKTEASKITDLYKEQDELLAGIFDGKYGSELEYQLESQLDTLLDRKQRIGVARYKWQNARVLLQHAVNQLAFAVTKWTEVQSLKADNVQGRYTVATEARNSLSAAHQNISNGQRYLATIQFPYLKPPELNTLYRATNNIYTDMQTPERHSHALNCYTVTHRRAHALLQWFDYVINTTIVKDLEKATLNVQTKERELRNERLQLIKAKIQKELGDDVDLNVDAELEHDEPAPAELSSHKELGQEENEAELALGGVATVTADNEVTKTSHKVDSTTNSQTGTSAAQTEDAGTGPTPLTEGELAPAPSMNDIFGNIRELKQKHMKEMEDLEHAHEVNKARMDQGLQDKLRARQSRRKRQLAQEDEEEQGASAS